MGSGIRTHLRRLILPVYLPMFLLSFGMSAPVAGFPQYLSGLGASLASVGFIVSLSGLGQLISDIPGGVILSRTRLRIVIFVCFLAGAAASAGIALTRGLFMVAILHLVTGTVTSVIVTAIMTYVRLSVPASARGRALSMVGGSFRTGTLVGTAVGGVVMDSLGVPHVFVLRIICFVGGIAATLIAPDRSVGISRSDRKPGVSEQFSLLTSGMRGRWSALTTVGTSVMILALLRATRSIALPLWGDALALSATAIGLIISAGSAIDLLLFVPAGLIMDRAGRKVAASLCIGVFSLGLLLLPLSHGLAGFVAASMLIGLGNGFGAGINMTLGTDLAPRGAVSAFLGIWRLFGDVGHTAGPVVVGVVASAIGLSASLFLTAGIGAAGLLLMVFVAPETLRIARVDSETGSDR